MSNVRENLIAAKVLIDAPEKWIKGDFSDEQNCFCVMGAVMHADQGDITLGSKMVDALGDAMPDEYHNWSIVNFNDDPGTTHADIMALFDRAIAATAPSGEPPSIHQTQC